MELPIVAYTVFDISFILIIGALALLFSKKVSVFPYPVLVFLAGIGLSFLNFDFLLSVRLDPEIILYIFLPLLLFESAYSFEFKAFKRVLSPSLLLATFGLFVAFGIISGAMLLLGFSPITAFLFAAVISSTDPIAVISIFKHIGIPKKLMLLIDSESFLNDATSIILFRILLSIFGIAGLQRSDSSLSMLAFETMGELIYIVASSVLIGAVVGWIYSEVVSVVKNNSSIETALSIISALLSFAIAEAIFEASGILAVLICGLVIGNYGSSKISPRVKESLAETFELAGFLAASFVFFLIGYTINSANIIDLLFYSLAAAIIVFIARGASVYISMIGYNIFAKDKIPTGWMHIINLSGIRGALPIVLILALPDTLEQKTQLLTLTTFVVMVTLIFNTLLVNGVLDTLDLHKLQLKEQIQHYILQLALFSRISKKIQAMQSVNEISNDEATEHIKALDVKHKQLTQAFNEIEEEHDGAVVRGILKNELQKLMIHIEHTCYFNLYANNVIDGNLFDKLQFSVSDQVEKIAFGKVFIKKRSNVETKIKKLNTSHFSILGIIRQFLGYSEEESITSILLYYKARVIGDKQVLNLLLDLESINKDSEISEMIMELQSQYNKILSYNLGVLKSLKEKYPNTYKSCEDTLCITEFDDLTIELKKELSESNIFSDSALNKISAPLLHQN